MTTRIVIVSDLMQSDYRYELTARTGRDFDPSFEPDLTPATMLELGVFGMGVLAFILSGNLFLGILLGTAAVLSIGLMFYWGQRGY